MTTSVSHPLFDGLLTFLRDDGWPTTVVSGDVPTLETRCAGVLSEWTCSGRTFEEQGQVVFDSALPIVVPEPMRADVALLLGKANWSLHTGAFALEPTTGEVRLRTSLVTQAQVLDSAAAKALVYANVLIVDRCLPTIDGAVNGSLSLRQAIDQLAL